jgi:hypothetical protein
LHNVFSKTHNLVVQKIPFQATIIAVNIPADLLLFGFRMGSFTSTAQVAGGDKQDEELEFPLTTIHQLLNRCSQELTNLPPPFHR